MTYAELYCLSNFSFLRGASHPKELVAAAAAQGYRALAITDECSLAGIVRAHEAAAEAGLHLIIGTEIRLQGGPTIVLLAPDHEAYTELCQLITKGRRRAPKGTYRLALQDLEELPHCLAIWIPDYHSGAEYVSWFKDHFAGRAWIGVTQLLEAEDLDRLKALRALGEASGIPLTAVGAVQYHQRQRRHLHDVLTAVRIGKSLSEAGHALMPNGERHLRPLATLQKLFAPALLQESAKIAEKCSFRLTDLRYRYPEELVPAERTPSEHLRSLTLEGERRRWGATTPPAVRAQIDRELRLVAQLGYEHYFLVVEDIVRFARSQGILCQGRGSAANSAVCYALGITEVDPARSRLLIERFISAERDEPPDIDVDFEHQRREEVMQYVYRRYGRERAALAATIICYRPRSAIRDVGKALGYSLDQVDALAKSVYWFEKAEELPERLQELGIDPLSHRAQLLVRLTQDLIGFPRHLSQHVGGFVISHHPLHTLVPVENAAMPDRTIIQWDKDDLETLKLLKIDCLALGMLSAVRRALDLVSGYRKKPMRMQDVPAEDPETYEMLCRGESTGVFQVESRAQMAMLPRLQPRKFYDLVVQVAIVRPGPIQGDMVHPYLRRRMGREQVEYPSPQLQEVLERTLGVPLFQEQVMEIAMVAAGFSGGEADQVRRSMSAWQRKGGLDKFREKLLGGMHRNGYSPEFADRIFQQILGFGSYGFPESHAASFAILVYVSAWLKRHEPAAFCAALLNSWPMGFYAPAQLVADARRARVTFRPVDVQASGWDCSLERGPDGTPAVRLGLRLVGGLAEGEALKIVQARSQGPFRGVSDVVDRTGIDRHQVKLLTGAGAFASLAGSRHAAQWEGMGIERLPGLLRGTAAAEPPIGFQPPTEGQDIVADYRSTGLTLGRHPLAVLRPRLARLKVSQAQALRLYRDGRRVRVAGLVTHRQRPGTASGVMFLSIEDETGVSNVIVWNRVQEEQRREILASQLVIVGGRLQNQDGVVHVVAEKVRDYSHWLGDLQVPSRDFH